MSTFSLLEKVAGIRQILTVVKAVQERKPDDSVESVLAAVEVALLVKLSKLASKPFASLTAAQVISLNALQTAKAVLPDVLTLLGDAETTRTLNADERAAMASLKAKATASRAASAEKRKAAKAVEPAKATKDLFATV